MSADSSSTASVRQWRIVALAVVSSSGRPLFLKNFPSNPSTAKSFSQALFRSNSLIPSHSVNGDEDDDDDHSQSAKMTNNNNNSDADDDSKKSDGKATTTTNAALKIFADETKKQEYISSWANPTSATTADNTPSPNNNNNSNNNPKSTSAQNKDAEESNQLATMDLEQALALALDCEDYTETETAQLFLYSALDRIDARKAVEERRSGNPFESRGYAVFDRETKTKMKAFVLVRYWGRSLPSECHLPCQTVLTQLIQKATFAFCDPFRDVALDEPLSESLLMDPFFRDILQPSTEIPTNAKIQSGVATVKR